MKMAALVLYVLGFALQMAGAIGVIQDVRTSIGNMRRLKSDLAAAQDTAQKHRRQITEFPIPKYPSGYGPDPASMAAKLAELADVAVEQTGPAPAEQRRALLRYVTAQDDIGRWRRWVPVGLLLGGVLVGFVGNVVSLFPL